MINGRAWVLVCPALLLIAHLTPGVRVSRAYGRVCELLHADGIGDATNPLEVRMQRVIDAAAVPGAPAVGREAVLRANFPDGSRIFIANLLEIALSEASVERFFSQLKLNIGDRRERMMPTAAISQVLFNSSLDFVENVSSGKPKPRRRDVISDDDEIPEVTEIPLTTWQWIFEQGCLAHWKKVGRAYD